MTEHRIMADLKCAETLLSQLQTEICERDSDIYTVSEIIDQTDDLDHAIYLLTRIRYDVQWRYKRCALGKETNRSTENPEDINAPR